MLIAYGHTEVPDAVEALIATRRPDLDPTDVMPVGLAAVQRRIEDIIEVGASKFVVLPLDEPADWAAELETIAADLLPLQN